MTNRPVVPLPLLLGMIVTALMVVAFYLGTLYGRQDPPPEPTPATIPTVVVPDPRDNIATRPALTLAA